MTENHENTRGINTDNIWFFIGHISSHVDPVVWERARVEAVRTLQELES